MIPADIARKISMGATNAVSRLAGAPNMMAAQMQGGSAPQPTQNLPAYQPQFNFDQLAAENERRRAALMQLFNQRPLFNRMGTDTFSMLGLPNQSLLQG
jgi:hypothetical protein